MVCVGDYVERGRAESLVGRRFIHHCLLFPPLADIKINRVYKTPEGYCVDIGLIEDFTDTGTMRTPMGSVPLDDILDLEENLCPQPHSFQ